VGISLVSAEIESRPAACFSDIKHHTTEPRDGLSFQFPRFLDIRLINTTTLELTDFISSQLPDYGGRGEEGKTQCRRSCKATEGKDRKAVVGPIWLGLLQ